MQSHKDIRPSLASQNCNLQKMGSVAQTLRVGPVDWHQPKQARGSPFTFLPTAWATIRQIIAHEVDGADVHMPCQVKLALNKNWSLHHCHDDV